MLYGLPYESLLRSLRRNGSLIVAVVCTSLLSIFFLYANGEAQSDAELRDLMKKESQQQNPCHVAQTIVDKITQPLYKFRGVNWNKREWEKWRNELAHGQDISTRFCQDWVDLTSRELGGPGSPGYSELDKIKAMAEAIHNLYNCGYDCAHNASRGDRSGFLAARNCYKQSLSKLHRICPSVVVPDSPCKVASQETESDCKCPDGSPCLHLGGSEPQCPPSELPLCEDMMALVKKSARAGPQLPGMYIDQVSVGTVQAKFGSPSCTQSSGNFVTNCWKCQKADGSTSFFTVTPGWFAVGLKNCNCQ